MVRNWFNRPSRIPAKAARKITGISSPFGGLSWADPGPSEADIARGYLVFLEDRRALYNPTWMEMRPYVVESINEVRRESTEVLKKLGNDSFASAQIRSIRAACRRFLDGLGTIHPDFEYSERFWDGEADFFVALGELRATVGLAVASLAGHYDVDVEGELASVFPALDSGQP